MEFAFSEREEAFRREIRDILQKHPPASFPMQAPDVGFGFGGWSNEFARFMGEQGWISLTWPEEFGGKARPIMVFLVLLDELSYAQAPTHALWLSGPMAHSIIEIGNDTLKREVLPGIGRGEVYFWLGLSEPGAGSDLLSLETRAVEEDDCYVINGQKVWSAYAQLARYGLLLARTDVNVPRHKGLSMFVFDKTLPGVTVRPLINMAGLHFHNEVFMDNVRVPKEYLLGEKNRGFYQMLKTLEVDRFWGRFVKPPLCRRVIDELVQYCKENKRDGMLLAKDSAVRHHLAESAIETEACRLLFYRAGWKINAGVELTYESTMAKAMADEMGQRLARKALQIMGPYAQSEEDPKWQHLRAWVRHLYLNSPGLTLAGGTSEMMRNTAATIGLGLPRT